MASVTMGTSAMYTPLSISDMTSQLARVGERILILSGVLLPLLLM